MIVARRLFVFLVIPVAVARPVGRLAIQAARRVKVIRLTDTVVATIVAIMPPYAPMVLAALSNKGDRIVAGGRCEDGRGQKIIAAQSSQGPSGPIYWACVPRDECEEWVAKNPAAQRRPASTDPTSERYLQHVARLDLALKTAVFGTIAALSGWLCAFGWRWRVWTDEL